MRHYAVVDFGDYGLDAKVLDFLVSDLDMISFFFRLV